MRAQTLWQMGRPEEAIKLLGPAIASSPDDYVLHDVAATAYGKLQRYEEAIVSARRVVELNPHAGRSHRRLADLLGKANRPREAREPALTAVRLEPDNSSAHATASETLRRCGDLRQATELAQRAIQLNPDRHLPLIGRLLVSSGRWQEAEAQFNRALSVYPDGWDTYFYLALSLVPQGRLSEAKVLLERFLGAHPDDNVVPLLWEHLAQWDNEERTLRRDIAAREESTDDKLDLASLLISQDRLAEAAEALRAVAEIEPPDSEAAARLHSLTARMQTGERGEDGEPPAMIALDQELRDEYHRRRETVTSAVPPPGG